MEFKFKPAIPRDSTILVTGINGLIALHVADQILASGYKVRGTVRNLEKNSWAASVLENKYGSGRVELIQLVDLSNEGVYEEVLKGAAFF